jgi:hypothetical protein
MFLYSCKKDFKQELQEPNSPNLEVKLEVKNGIIAFKDSKSFENAMSYFHTIGIEETHKIIRQLPYFKGLIEITPNDKDDIARLNKALWKLEEQEIRLRENMDDVPPAEALTYDDYLIHDPYYEAILNTHRELMIDQLIIRSTENGVFGYEPERRLNFDAQYETPVFDQALSNAYTSDDLNGLIDMPVVLPDIYLINRDAELFEQYPPVVLTASCNGGKLATNAFGQQQDCDTYLDNRRRIRATVWAQNLGLYSSIGFKTRRQTRFLRVWWNAEAERLSVEGEGYYSTKWPSGLVYTDYYYGRPSLMLEGSNIKKIDYPMPQPFHTAEIGVKDGKPKMKLTKKYEYKKHKSDHAGWHNGIRYAETIKHN